MALSLGWAGGPNPLDGRPELRTRLEAAAAKHCKAVAVAPVFDTIKRVRDGVVQATVQRDNLRWPIAWAYSPGFEPRGDPPPAAWFESAAVVE